MAGGIFRVVELTDATSEDGAVEELPKLYTEVELIERFAPKFDTKKASQAKLINEWVKTFSSSEAIQAGFGVQVDKVDARQVFEQRLETFQALEKAAVDAKKELTAALRSVLSDVTSKDIAEGDVHATSTNGKNKVGVVEYYVAKSKVPVKDLLSKYGHDFPAEVRDELKKLQEKRATEARKRLEGRS